MAYLRDGAPPGSRCTCGIKALCTVYTRFDTVYSFECRRHSEDALQALRTVEAKKLTRGP